MLASVGIQDQVIAEFVPVIERLAVGRCAVTLGGSRAKARTDGLSDYDFRLYADGFKDEGTAEWAAFKAVRDRWEARGTRIDGVWMRPIAAIDPEVDLWVQGQGTPTDLEWSIWGYYLPTDLAHQMILSDPDGIAAGWKARLIPCPETMAEAAITKWMSFLRYWRGDYHYESKVLRGDPVFLSGLTAKLVHGILQVTYALNRAHFPGDGWNLELAAGLPLKPNDLATRITTALDPAAGPDRFARQRLTLIALIDDLDRLIP